MRFILVAALLVLAPSHPFADEPVDCEAARCAAQDAIDDRCPCAAATTHGAHVRCVASAARALAADGTLPRRCVGAVKRCAARSTCGRAGFVVCDVPEVIGACAIGLGFCHHPDGSILFSHPCSSDADCVIESRCAIKASAERCTARGGTVATRSSCCAACPPAPGTPCGPGLVCGEDEICVVFGPFGPGGFSRTCRPVPAGCELDRSCGCTSAALCSPPNACRDVDAPGDVIFCECAACV